MRILVSIVVTLGCCLALPTQKQTVPRVESDPELTAGYFEGDIELESLTRNGLRDQVYRWPDNVVYYHINSDIDKEHRNHILRGLSIIEDISCITFKEVPTDYPFYVNVTSEPTGCHSNVGYLNRIQRVNFQDYPLNSGCYRLGTIVHEFLHTLGFHHQQSTSNRDDYVQIVEENIQDGKLHNFNKYSNDVVENYGEEYDYGSVLHYSAYAFSANGEMTIVPLKEGAEEQMGQRLSLSQPDINKLNAMYRCPKKILN